MLLQPAPDDGLKGNGHMKAIVRHAAWMLATLVVLSACQGSQGKEQVQEKVNMDLQVASAAFEDGEPIPTAHTCDGDDVSPSLRECGHCPCKHFTKIVLCLENGYGAITAGA